VHQLVNKSFDIKLSVVFYTDGNMWFQESIQLG